MTNASIDEFSLQGGPLYKLGRRWGLVRDSTDTTLIGLALGGGAWLILVALALLGGVTDLVFSLDIIASHIRLLLVIPLFFVCEALAVPRMSAFVRTIVNSGVVPGESIPLLAAELARIQRWKASWVPETIFLVVTVPLFLADAYFPFLGVTASHDAKKLAAEAALAVQWYFIVCLPLFRFLLLRWIWHLALWYFLLWRISRLQLRLVPTHPDGAGGLGYLELVQSHFSPLVFAISALQAAIFAENFAAGTVAFEQIYPTLALVYIVIAVLFVGPLFIFSTQLWDCQVRSLSGYMEFAARYVNDFERKWMNPAGNPANEPLLGTPDLQSLADLNNSMSVVHQMRWVPISMHLLSSLAGIALLPMLPLLLLKYPLSELLQNFFMSLAGL